MKDTLGQTLSEFDAALTRFRDRLDSFPELRDQLFKNTVEWIRLLKYKLLPHLAGEGCLVAAVAGGTNTGKSTVFNLLLGDDVSPVRTTAAATARPVLAGNALRAAQCLDNKLMPEFEPLPLTDREEVVRGATPPNTLFVAEQRSLPDRLVLLDIPDIDSIDQQNWEVAENIQAAGDVLVAVLTGEKYKDDRVIAFFRRAHAAGRVILPLMNKAHPKNGYEVARTQLADFRDHVGLDRPACFVLPHDYDLAGDFRRPVPALDGGQPLRAHLESLDVPAIKERVYRDTVARFAEQTAEFLERISETYGKLRGVVTEFEARAHTCAEQYDPEPGEKVGSLLHEYIQARRGFLGRTIGGMGNALGRVLSPVGRFLSGALRERITLEDAGTSRTHSEILARRRQDVEVLARNLARDYVQTARNLWEPAATLVSLELAALRAEDAVWRVTEAAVEEQNVSQAFRDHAQKTLEAWWRENRIRRQLLLELDTLLVIAPTAVAVPLAVYSGGVGVPEVMAAAGPLAGTFFAKIMEHQFADKWLDLIAPWRREQHARLRQALLNNITRPALRTLDAALEAFEDSDIEMLRKYSMRLSVANARGRRAAKEE